MAVAGPSGGIRKDRKEPLSCLRLRGNWIAPVAAWCECPPGKPLKVVSYASGVLYGCHACGFRTETPATWAFSWGDAIEHWLSD